MQESFFSDLNELSAFVALADTGSFSAAGRQIGRDATAVSRRLSAMEARLGVRLADRSTRKVALTEAGQRYLARIRPLLDGLQSAGREAAEQVDGQVRGHLRISLPGSFARRWMTPLIVGFLRAHPLVTIEADTSNRFVDLIGEHYDLAIRLGVLADSRLVARKVAERRRVICASPAFLMRHPHLQAPQDLAGVPCLCNTRNSNPYRWAFTQPAQRREVVSVRGLLASEEPELLIEAALEGLGVLHSTRWYVDAHLREGSLVEVIPDWQLDDRGAVYVITPATSGTPNKTRAFSDWVAQHLASELG
ncbi:LysR family transcriptional regulator [Pseudomonas sp. SLFW]|uniref:LysR family transcriptional regulator n=1 Tax=Pseudomonas sp. SLFW TaxID=2683259 RepID=UPI001413335A|nr:LysR family transcriptional regulator [Pseudomonas sp. SLFW]NBB11195.1 LysR family transcriptional regulator [Pseudomonas sp. SLFW]